MGIQASLRFSFNRHAYCQTEILLIRLFIGIPIPADIRTQLSQIASGLPGARWRHEKSYHLTLRYIGEVDQGTADDIHAMLGYISVEPFCITLSGVGYFGKANSARAVWADVETNVTLARLRNKIETLLQRINLPAEERKYKPHVTLARLGNAPVGRLEAYIINHGDFAAKPFKVSAFTLFSSSRSSSGSIYIPEAVYKLRSV